MVKDKCLLPGPCCLPVTVWTPCDGPGGEEVSWKELASPGASHQMCPDFVHTEHLTS